MHDSLEATIAAAAAVPEEVAAGAASVVADARAWEPYDDHSDAPIVTSGRRSP